MKERSHSRGRLGLRQRLIAAAAVLGLCTNPSVAGKIEGVVVAPNGAPLAEVNVALQGTPHGAHTSAVGGFRMDKVPAGNHTLLLSRVGFRGHREVVVVPDDGTKHVRVTLEADDIEMPPLVVTGTRSAKTTKDAPVWSSVITRREIVSSGGLRLRDLLDEEIGITVVSDYSGNGIQMQGFDPDCTLVLVDGEPVIGPTSGTLELDRFALANVEQVEIVKGATSSLYGSEALAGVINLITRAPAEPFAGELRTRFGSLGELDASGRVEMLRGAAGLTVYVNRNRSGGYDLAPETVAPTVPEHVSYTAQSKVTLRADERTDLSLSGRVFTESQDGRTEVTEAGSQRLLRDFARQTDLRRARDFLHDTPQGDQEAAQRASFRTLAGPVPTSDRRFQIPDVVSC